MEPRINIVTLGVSDLRRSTSFYRDRLHFPITEGSNEEISFFRTGGVLLALFPNAELAADATVRPEGSGFKGFTLAHNVRTPAEVDSLLKEVEAAGARIVKPAQPTSWGGYGAYFADPDGFLWEVAYNPFSPLKPDGTLDMK